MKLMIIRHADPDYEHDSLTEKGWREAEYLSEMLSRQQIDHFYMSPYGRAQDTASLTLKKMDRTAEVMPWLREFDVFINRPDDHTRKRIPWDWLPQDWTQEPRHYDRNHWYETDKELRATSPFTNYEEWVVLQRRFDAIVNAYYKDNNGALCIEQED